MRYLIKDLSPGQAYGIRFRLVGNGQQSDWSSIKRFQTDTDVTAPANVTGLQVKPIGTAFEMTWNKVTTNVDGSALKDFKDYQVAVTSGALTRVWYVAGERFDLPLEVNTNAFGSPQPNISVTVSARDNTLNTAPNPPVVSASNATPNAPTSVTPLPYVNGIEIKFTKSTSTDVINYRLYRGTSSSAINTLTEETSGNAFKWFSTDFSTTYWFKVAAVDVYGQETLSSAVSGAPLAFDASDASPPAAPTWPASWFVAETDLSNRYNAVANVSLTWNANAETDLGSYNVRWKKAADSVWSSMIVRGTATTPPENTAKIYGLAINTAYNFQVSASDKTGNTSAYTAAPNSGTTTADTTPPPAPSTPTITSLYGSVKVNWDGLASGGSAMPTDTNAVEVHASATSGFTPTASTQVDMLSSVTSGRPQGVILGGLTIGTTYYIKLVAIDFGGNRSPASGQATGVPKSIVQTDINFNARDIGAPIVYYQTTQPASGMLENDIWFDIDDGYKPYTYKSGTWNAMAFGASAIAANAITAVKINAGAVTADKVGANQIITTSANIGTAVIQSANIASINAAKITTGELAAGVRIIAGPVNDTHAEMTSTGFRVYGKQPDTIDPATGATITGQVTEVVRLGTDSNDFFAVTQSDGSYAATIDDTGRASFADLVVAKSPTFGGRTLDSIIERLPKGVVARGEFQSNQNNVNTEIGLFEVAFTALPNRMYRTYVTNTQWGHSNNANGLNVLYLLRATSPSSPNTWAELQRFNKWFEYNASNFNHGDNMISHVWASPEPGLHRVVLSVYSANSGMHAFGFQNLIIEDLGPTPPNVAVAQTLGGSPNNPPPQPVVQTYTKQYGTTWSQSYKGDNSIMSNANGLLYQGYESYNGNTRSLVGWNAGPVMADLAGATVNNVQFFLYAAHWYNNSGGTAVLGAHGLDGPPGSYAGLIDPGRFQSGNWPKPGGRWLDITAWGNEIKAGSVRGIAIGYAPNNDRGYYGYFHGHTYTSGTPTLQITFTK